MKKEGYNINKIINLSNKANNFSLNETIKERNYYCIYTILFMTLCLLIYLPFIKNGKSNIWDGDVIAQHYTNLLYFKNWVNKIFVTLFTEARFEIPMWDMQIGLGQDFFNVISFRPLNVISFLFSTDSMELYYWIRHLLCLFLGGISFSLFLKKMKGNLDLSILLGAFSFIFCGFSLSYMIKHAIFIEQLIYLPLFLLGIEKIYRNESSRLFSAVTAMCGISYFYNLFALTIFGGIYAAYRYFFLKKEKVISFIKVLLHFAFWYIWGLGLVAFSLVPNLLLALYSRRIGKSSFTLLYNKNYYLDLIRGVIGNSQIGIYGYLGLSSLVIFTIIFLFVTNKPKDKLWRILIVSFVIMLSSPVFSGIFNGFAGTTSRWCLIIPFVVSIILSYQLPEIFKINANELIKIIYITIIYIFLLAMLSILGVDISYYQIITLLTFALFIMIVYIKKYKNITIVIILLFIVELSIDGYEVYSPKMSSFISEFTNTGTANDRVWDTSAKEVFTVDDQSVYRTDAISKNYKYKSNDSNYGLRSGQNGISLYYSYTDSHIVNASQELGNSQTHSPSYNVKPQIIDFIGFSLNSYLYKQSEKCMTVIVSCTE